MRGTGGTTAAVTVRSILAGLALTLVVQGCAATGGEELDQRQRARMAEARGSWLVAGDAWLALFERGGDSDPQVVRGLARALTAQGDPAGALRVLEGARARGVSDAHLAHDLGSALAAAERVPTAIAAHLEAAELDPGWAAPRQAAGELLLAAGRSAEAVAPLRAAAALDGGDPRTALLLARALTASGATGEALVAWEAALERGAFTPAVALEAARLVDGGTDDPDALERALAWLERAVGEDPQLVVAHRRLGELALAVGRPERAGEALRRAVELDPGDLDGLYLLASLRARTGDQARLQSLVQHAFEVTSDAQQRARFLALLSTPEGDTAGDSEGDPGGDPERDSGD